MLDELASVEPERFLSLFFSLSLSLSRLLFGIILAKKLVSRMSTVTRHRDRDIAAFALRLRSRGGSYGIPR